jgi:hypothetical protein
LPSTSVPSARLCIVPNAGPGIVPADIVTAFPKEPDTSEE